MRLLFYLRDDWIRGSKDGQQLLCFTDDSGTEEATEAGKYGPRKRLFCFCLRKEMCKIKLWKRASFSIGVPFWETWKGGGCSFPGEFESQVRLWEWRVSVCTGAP